MANAENTASLPPIIEDEGDENLLPMFYQKELERKGYHSQEKSSPSIKRDFSEQTNETQLPYNSWKAKNRMLNRGGENGVSPDMVSRLGQSLENCHSVVPGRSLEGYQSANHPHAIYVQDNSAYQAHNVINTSEPNYVSPGNIEMKRYLHTQQDVPKNPHVFDSNCIQNSMPGMYPGGYPGFLLNSNKNMISPNGNSPFHGRSAVNNPYKHCDVSPASYKLHSSPKSSYNPHPLSPGFHHENPRFEKSPCQKNCCQGSFSGHMSGLMSADGPHLNFPHANYENSVSSHHSSKQKKINCHCCQGLETKSPKKDKRTEKNMNKQINDLYRIVWLQNQQLIQLQNDFKQLIEYNLKSEERNQKLSEQEHLMKKQSKSTMEKRMFNLHVIEENKNLMEKVSVGIMTSFIDTTSVKKKKKSKDIKKTKEIQPASHNSSSESETSSSVEFSCEEKERVITQGNIQKKMRSKKNKSGRYIEDSILLNGTDIPARIEHSPSPTGSVNIDMQDYASSSNSDTSDDSDSTEDKPAPVGWTFYDKVVGKVNHMLNESESETEEDSENEIRNKTLEQLRRLGVSIEESPASKRVTFNEAAYVPQQQKLFLGESDTSMKMNALAMKYLQEDKAMVSASPKSVDKCTGGLTNNTNLSVATLRYLEKYHLPMVSGSPEVKIEKSKKKKDKRKDEKKDFKKKTKASDHSGKILDITAIKQQPKLLPKTQ
ncbi:SCL-interrupting locus protein homolog isoform X2 [Halyomorpha halys]|uniref:SCL-interrupting locus protein homolog isoform X2 n=1 Tax=Halyomorpha halys TaxID=286706 RepID=UPI0006D4CFB3|nr:uncharacterized protein LOC106688167 isoform X2 [Halyomorpha halys]